jgi:FHA domain
VTATCPHGHESSATDYCDVCGARLDQSGTTAIIDAVAPAAATCPRCGAARGSGERFCEACGHDASAPVEPTPQAVAPASWLAIVTVDPEQFARSGPEQLLLPEDRPERELALDEPSLRIGRGRGEVALDDPAVSQAHAELIRQPDGTYAVIDLGSTNGTAVGQERIEPHTPATLDDGDRIHVGAWTCIIIRRSAG